MIKARDDWDIVLGGPGSRLDTYSSMNFFKYSLRKEKRKEKIKKIFNEDRKEVK
jgi:hypothetical protein